MLYEEDVVRRKEGVVTVQLKLCNTNGRACSFDDLMFLRLRP